METIVLPKEIEDLYNAFYEKVKTIVEGGAVIDLKNDFSAIAKIIEAAMTVVENFRNKDGEGWSGDQKRQYAIALIKRVLADLTRHGKISQTTHDEVVRQIDIWGSVVMKVAIDAFKNLLALGNKGDEAKKGCCSIM